MRQRAIIAALLVVGVGVVLGATVFRTDIAQATGLAQSVTVDNTTTNPVPVREVNTDSAVGDSIKVHEEGTASVNVTNSSLQVTGPVATRTWWRFFNVDANGHQEENIGITIKASLITFTSMQGEGYVRLYDGADDRLLYELDVGTVILPLTQPMTVNRWEVSCQQSSPVPCTGRIEVVGT